MKEVLHAAANCNKVAFYCVNFPIGRGFLSVDALDKQGIPLAQGNRVECVSCGNKVNLAELSDYYEMEPV